MKRSYETPRAVAVALPANRTAGSSLWLQFLAAATLVALSFVVSGALR